MIINPGSGPVENGTYEQAEENAKEWHAEMEEEGITETELVLPGTPSEDGRWKFVFRHRVTGRTATLRMHGLTEEQENKLLFGCRVYWNGGSSRAPDLVRDFGKPGYHAVLREVKS